MAPDGQWQLALWIFSHQIVYLIMREYVYGDEMRPERVALRKWRCPFINEPANATQVLAQSETYGGHLKVGRSAAQVLL